MDERTRQDYARYRLEKAEQCLKTARQCISYDDYGSATNRSYYAVFHSIRAILALDGVDFKRHSAVISYFRREYVRTGVFDVEYSDILGDLFEARGSSDYDDFYVVSKERVEMQMENASRFYGAVKEYIEVRLSGS